MKKIKYSVEEIKALPSSEVEIRGEIAADEMSAEFERALKELAKEIELPGFRKGHVPEKIAAEKIGDHAILEHAAERLLGDIYAEIVTDKKLEVISRPNVEFTKIAKGNPLGFKIRVAVFPKIELPEYKKIHEKLPITSPKELEVTDVDVEKTLKELQEARGKIKKNEIGQTSSEIPALDDAFAKSLGNFASLADLKEKIKKGLGEERRQRAKEKKRAHIADLLVKEVKTELPEVLIEGELAKMKAQFEGDLNRMGTTYEKYLSDAKKTDEAIKKEWLEDAKKRVILQILLNKISLHEKIAPSDKQVAREVSHILEHHKEADKERVKNYVEMMLTNDMVFELLETGVKSELKDPHDHHDHDGHNHDDHSGEHKH